MLRDRVLKVLLLASLAVALLAAVGPAFGFFQGFGPLFLVLFLALLVSGISTVLLLYSDAWLRSSGTGADGAQEERILFSERLGLVSEAGQEMVSSFDLASVEDKAIESLRKIFGARAVFIMLYDQSAAALRMHRYRGMGKEHLEGLELGWGEGISGRVFATGRSEYVPDISESEEVRFSEEMSSAGMESLWALPLVFREERLGVLGLFLPPPEIGDRRDLDAVMTEDEKELGQVFAQQLAVAVQNARYYRRLDEAVEVERRHSVQFRVLNELAVVLNSEEDTGRMLDDVLAGATRLTGAAQGFLYLQTEDGLQLEAFHGDPEAATAVPVRSPHSDEVRSYAVQALEERGVVRLSKESEDREEGFLGFLATPLLDARDAPLGCIVVVGDPSGYGFTAEDEMLITTLTSHVAVALQNLQRLQEEQGVAEYLQRAMLPGIPRVQGLDLDLCYESAAAARLVGGDFYDVVPLSRGRVCLVVGDVCGKGLNAATQMAMVRYIIRAYAALDLPPGHWMRLVNDSVVADLSDDDFITALMVVVDPFTRSVRYALAGHPPPILAAGGGTGAFGGAPGLPLGVQEGGEYRTYAAHFPADATVVLYTDGLYEARRGSELFGFEAMTEAIARESEKSFREGARRLVGSAREFAGGSLGDDVVVMLARLRGIDGEETDNDRPATVGHLTGDS